VIVRNDVGEEAEEGRGEGPKTIRKRRGRKEGIARRFVQSNKQLFKGASNNEARRGDRRR
jgi:hypothetical protein